MAQYLIWRKSWYSTEAEVIALRDLDELQIKALESVGYGVTLKKIYHARCVECPSFYAEAGTLAEAEQKSYQHDLQCHTKKGKKGKEVVLLTASFGWTKAN